MRQSKLSKEQLVYTSTKPQPTPLLASLCQQFEVSDAIFHAWKRKHAHLRVSEQRYLLHLKEESNRLKRLVADLSLDKYILLKDLRIQGQAPPASEIGSLVS